MTVRYELKKILLKRYGIVMILIALLLKIISLICSSDAAAINIQMEENKAVFLSYIQTLSGEINEEKLQFIRCEEEYFANTQAAYKKMEQQYLNGSCTQLDYLQAVEAHEAAEEKQAAFSVVQGQYLAAQSDSQRYFMYTNGWARLLTGNSIDWVLIFLICIITVPVVCAEYSCEMAQLLSTTKNGRNRLYLSKLTAVLIVASILSCIFFLSELLYAQLCYGLQHADYPLQAIPQFVGTEYRLSILQALCFIAANRILGICYLSVLLFFASVQFKKPLPCMFVGLSGIFLPVLLLSESELQYTLPLPVGMLRADHYLQSSFYASYTSDVVISLTKSDYVRTVSIIAAAALLIALHSVMKHNRKLLSVCMLCLCVPWLPACSTAQNKFYADRVYNAYESYRNFSNENYTVALSDGVPILYDNSGKEQTELVRTPFFDTAVVLYPAVYADDTAVYRLEHISDFTISGTGSSLYTEQIVKTDLSDFSETVIYRNEILSDHASSFLGLGAYFPSPELDLSESVHAFVVCDDTMIILKENGLYCIPIGQKQGEKLVDGTIRAWSCAGECVYYIDAKYSLHSININTRTDEIICDEYVFDIYLTEDAIYAKSITRQNMLITKPLRGGTWEIAEAEDAPLYFIGKDGRDAICYIKLKSNSQPEHGFCSPNKTRNYAH